MANKAKVGEVIEGAISAMNLGRAKVYNVRAVLACEGLNPSGTFFIGDLEAGSTKTVTNQISVTSLSGENMYGTAVGSVTYYYEDEEGHEFQETKEVTFVVETPFSNNQVTKEQEDKPKQWYYVMLVIGGVLAVMVGVGIVNKIRKRDDHE